jgi:hypothetical protein
MEDAVDENKIDAIAEVQSLLEAWCDRRCYKAICILYGGYSSINGLTDGWGDLLQSLKCLRNLSKEERSGILETEAAKVRLLIGVVSRALNNR